MKTNYAYASDDPAFTGYKRCPTCDHPAAVSEFEKGPDGVVHCNHCRVGP